MPARRRPALPLSSGAMASPDHPIERALEKTIFASRWLLAPFFLGLIVAMAVLLVKFTKELLLLLQGVMGFIQHDSVISILTLVDTALIAVLLLIIVFSAYENFVSKLSIGDHEDRPAWMGKVGFADLKMKLIGAIVAISAVELLACEARWNTHIHDVARFHAHHDLWLTPTVAAPPVTIGSMDTPWALAQLSDVARRMGLAGVMRHTSSFKNTVLQNLGWTPYTQLANLTGRPAMSVPLYWTSQNLPLGVQFVAPLDGEGLLLRLAAQLEQAQPWFERRPALHTGS